MDESQAGLAAHGVSPAADREVVITRTFDAPRALVFRAWVDREQLMRWFAPHGCSLEIRTLDVREGGAFHYCIRNPRYGDCWTQGTFHEVCPPERLTFTISLTDEQGQRVKSTAAGKDPDWPEETTVTVTFTEVEGKTSVTLHQTVAESVARRTGAYPSWLEMLDQLAADLAADRAPRE